MAKKPTYKVGEKEPASGMYVPVNAWGSGDSRAEITVGAGFKLPPTPGPNQEWQLVDPTKNKGPKDRRERKIERRKEGEMERLPARLAH